jgi:transcriptional regulator with XRE-family HTH domain
MPGERKGGRASTDAGWRRWMGDFGQHVRRVREFVGLSQADLARRAGVSQGAVSRFEAGRGLKTPYVVIVRINLALSAVLGTLDSATLTEDVRRFMAHMELLDPPSEPGGPPGSGLNLQAIELTAERELEMLVRLYRSLPEERRRAFVAAMKTLASTPGE